MYKDTHQSVTYLEQFLFEGNITCLKQPKYSSPGYQVIYQLILSKYSHTATSSLFCLALKLKSFYIFKWLRKQIKKYCFVTQKNHNKFKFQCS